MSEKRAKEARKENSEPRLLNTIEFRIMSNGHIQVSGPISDPALFMDVVGRGMMSVAQWHAQQKQSRIIAPDAGLTMMKGN